ncbi:MAG: hypothetical protein ACREEM_33790 [Blastocatellia bacterium]
MHSWLGLLAFEPENFSWASVLVLSIGVSLFGSIVSNSISELRKSRPHNQVKLLNECLYRHQLSYITYYGTMVIVVEFGTWRLPIGRFGIFLILLSIFCYIIGLVATIKQDEKLNHKGQPCKTGCQKPLTLNVLLKVVGMNVFCSIISVATAFVIAFSSALSVIKK